MTPWEEYKRRMSGNNEGGESTGTGSGTAGSSQSGGSGKKTPWQDYKERMKGEKQKADFTATATKKEPKAVTLPKLSYPKALSVPTGEGYFSYPGEQIQKDRSRFEELYRADNKQYLSGVKDTVAPYYIGAMEAHRSSQELYQNKGYPGITSYQTEPVADLEAYIEPTEDFYDAAIKYAKEVLPYGERAGKTAQAASEYQASATGLYDTWKSRVRSIEEIQADIDGLTDDAGLKEAMGASYESAGGGMQGLVAASKTIKDREALLQEELTMAHMFQYGDAYRAGDLSIVELYDNVQNDAKWIRRKDDSVSNSRKTLVDLGYSEDGIIGSGLVSEEDYYGPEVRADVAAHKAAIDEAEKEIDEYKRDVASKNREAYDAYWTLLYMDYQNAEAGVKGFNRDVYNSLGDGGWKDLYDTIAYGLALQKDDANALVEKGMSKFLLPSADVFVDDYNRETIDSYDASQLSEDERGLLLYLINTKQFDAAKIFLTDMLPVMTGRGGESLAKDLDFPVVREVISGIQGLDSGVRNLGYGIASTFFDMDAPELTTSDYMQAYWQDKHKGSLAGFTTSAANSIGNMVPMVAASTVGSMLGGPGVGAVAGRMTTFFNSRGSAYADAKRNGASHSQAWVYSTMSGAAEAGLEALLGSAGGVVSGKIPEAVKSKFSDVVKNLTSKKWGELAVDYGVDIISETIEEELQLFLDPGFKMLAGMEDGYKLPNWDEILETAIVTWMSSSFYYGGNKTVDKVADAKKQSQYDSQVKECIKSWKTAGEGSPLYLAAMDLEEHFKSNKHITPDQVLAVMNRYSSSDSSNGKTVSKTKELLGKVDENTDAYAILRAMSSVGVSMTEDNRVHTMKELMEQGMSREEAQQLTETAQKAVEGKRLTSKEKALLQKESPLSQMLRANLQRDTSGTVTPDRQTLGASVQSEQATKQTGTETQQVAEAPKATIAKIKGVDSTNDLDEGSLPVESERFETDEEIMRRVLSGHEIPEETIKALVEDYDGSEDLSPELYARATAEAFYYGEHGIPKTELATGSGLTPFLTERQRNYAYEHGRITGQTTLERENQMATGNGARSAKATQSGRVLYEGTISTENRSKLQEVSLQALDKLAESLGIHVYLFESQTDAEGKPVGENGWYDPKTGDIHIDLNAGEFGQGTILFTAAHELTHFIRQWSPARFKVLSEFLMEKYAEKGISVSDLVRRQQEKARRNGRKLSYGEAYEEMIADSMETMLSDGAVLERIQELKEKDKGLVQKIRNWLRSFAAKLRKAYNSMDPDTAEGKLVSEMAEAVEQIHELFAQGLVEASANFNHAEAQKNTTDEGGVMFSGRKNENDNSRDKVRTHSYDELTSKEDLKGNVIEAKVKIITSSLSNGTQVKKIDADWIAQEVLKHCESVQTKAPIPTYYVKVSDIGKNVEVTKTGIKHGFIKADEKNNKQIPVRSMLNARAALDLPNILRNSIEVNRANRGDNAEVEFTHILLGVTAMKEDDGSIGYYAVRSVVEARKNQGAILTQANVIGKLHAMNAKKIGKPHAQVDAHGNALTQSSLFTYSVADLLEDVKYEFDDTFSKNVYEKLGITRKDNDFSKYLIHSARGNLTTRSILTDLDPSTVENETERNQLVEYQENSSNHLLQQKLYRKAQSEYEALSKEKKPDKQKMIRAKSEATKAKNRMTVYAERLEKAETGMQLRRLINREVKKVLSTAVSTYGAIPAGENPATNRVVEMPKSMDGKTKVSRVARSAAEANMTPNDFVPMIEEAVANGFLSYDPDTNKAQLDRAHKWLEYNGWDDSLFDWMKDATGKKRLTKDDIARGIVLYNNLANQANAAKTEEERMKHGKNAIRVLTEIQAMATEQAQALQAMRIMKKQGPEMQYFALQKSVKKIEDGLTDSLKKKLPEGIKLNETLVAEWMDALRSEDEIRIEAAQKALYRDIAAQVPVSFREKWNTWRYLAMLLNPRTHIRNILGNAGFVPVRLIKNSLATGMEAIGSGLSGGRMQRTKAVLNLAGQADRALWRVAREDYKNVEDLVQSGGKYNDNANDKIMKERAIFKARVLEWLRKLNEAGLGKEDTWFSGTAYATALAGYLKAHGITADQIQKGTIAQDQLDRARAYAIVEAAKATYRDTNEFSAFISKIGKHKTDSKSLSFVDKTAGVLIEGVLPFRKTPANILVRGVGEYSPIGLLRGVKQLAWDVPHGNLTAAEGIDMLASGLTGTMLLGLGIWLCSIGLISGVEDDEEKRKFEQLMGHQNYALNVGDGSYTIDWLAPEALPVFVGVEIAEAFRDRDGKINVKTVMDAISNISEPILEMSMLSSLNDLLDDISYSDSKIWPILATAATNYLTQFVPSVFGSIERTTEDRRYTTYADKDHAFLQDDWQFLLANLGNKAPFEYKQIPFVDAWGREEDTGEVAFRLFSNFISPGYYSKTEKTPADDELMRLYDLGYEDVFPQRIKHSYKISYKVGEDTVKRYLEDEEYVCYAKTKGQTGLDLLCTIFDSSWYKDLDDATKADVVEYAYSYANEVGKSTAVSQYLTEEGWEAKAIAATELGISPDIFIRAKIATSGIVSIKNENGNPISNSKGLLLMREIYKIEGLTDEQRKCLFAVFGVGGNVISYSQKEVERALKKMGAE